MKFSVAGYFRLQVLDKRHGVVHDTGFIKNRVTRYGYDLLLGGFFGFGDPDSSPHGFGVGKKYGSTWAQYIGVGTGSVTVPFDYYTYGSFYGENAEVAYPEEYTGPDETKRAYLNASADFTVSIDEGDPTVAGSYTGTATFGEGFVPTNLSLTQVGLFNYDYGSTVQGHNLMAGTSFNAVPVTTTQMVTATYKLSVSQEDWSTI